MCGWRPGWWMGWEGEYEKDEVGRLREEAEMLQQQLDEVIARLDRSTAS